MKHFLSLEPPMEVPLEPSTKVHEGFLEPAKAVSGHMRDFLNPTGSGQLTLFVLVGFEMTNP